MWTVKYVDGGLKLTVLTTKSERSWAKLDGPVIQKWTVKRAETGRSVDFKLAGQKGPIWTVLASKTVHLGSKRPSTIVLDRLVWLK